MIRRDPITLLTIAAMSCAVVLQAAPDPPAPPAVSSQVLFYSQLVRVAEGNTPAGNNTLGFFGAPIGSDTLSAGTVELTRDRQITITVEGAFANSAYSVTFCRFGLQVNPGCLSLGPLTTNVSGDGTASVAFPANSGGTDVWNGAFVIMRNATAEFISGFRFPPTPPAPAAGVQLQLTGQIQSMSGAGGTFRLAGLGIDILTGNSTKFQGGGIHNLGDLKVGDVVQVDGFTQSNGSIFATDVKFTPSSNNGNGNGNGNGKDRGDGN